jgi:hypothetical protein
MTGICNQEREEIKIAEKFLELLWSKNEKI